AERRRGGGLADAALEAEHGDLVATAQRLVDPRDQLAATHVGRALAEVDQAAGHLVQTAPPAGLRRPLGLLDQLLWGQRVLLPRLLLPVLLLGIGLLRITTRLGVGLLLRITRLLRGIHGVRARGRRVHWVRAGL